MNWAPWITDPDDPHENLMTKEEMSAAALKVRMLTWDYDPDQPRDPKGSPTGGQWTSQKMDPENSEPNAFAKYMSDEMWRRMRNAIAVAKAMPETYLIDNEQRRAMRKAIEDKLYNRDIDKRVQGREATIILGLPGAGKSTLANPLIKAGAIEIDPDIVKQEIPEFNGGIGANAVHEESSAISKNIVARAIANGDNIVWPRIDGKDKLERDIKRLQAEGYKVHVSIIDVSQETAIRSAVDRYEHTGRLVSPSTVLEYGNTPEETYQMAKSIEGVTVARYRREHGKGVEPVVDDAGFNPNQPRDKEGQWTETTGIYAGTSKSTRGKKKTARHKVFAHSADEAKKIMAERHREEHKLHPSDFIHVGEFQFIGEEKEPPPPPKPPNRGSKEDLFRQEMQRRVDEQKGYKGD